MATIRVVLAAGSTTWREAARRCLEAEADLSLVADVADGRHAVAAVTAHRPAVVLVDRQIAENAGLRVVGGVRRAHPATRILVVGRPGDDAFAVEVVKRGGHGVMPDSAVPTHLPRALRCLFAGEAWLSRAQEARVLEALWQLREGAEAV